MLGERASSLGVVTTAYQPGFVPRSLAQRIDFNTRKKTSSLHRSTLQLLRSFERERSGRAMSLHSRAFSPHWVCIFLRSVHAQMRVFNKQLRIFLSWF